MRRVFFRVRRPFGDERRSISIARAVHELKTRGLLFVVHARPDGDTRHAARGADSPPRLLPHDRAVLSFLEHLLFEHVRELRTRRQLAERGRARGGPRVLRRGDRRGRLERDDASRPSPHGHRDAPRRGGARRLEGAFRATDRGEAYREKRDSTRRRSHLAPGAGPARLGRGRGRLRGSAARIRSGGHARGVECATRSLKAFSFVFRAASGVRIVARARRHYSARFLHI